MAGETLTIDLPQQIARLGGGLTDKLELREPRLGELLVSEKETETGMAPHQMRARDIKLLSLVAKVEEVAIRGIPVSILARSTAFLRGFLNESSALDASGDQIVLQIVPPLTGPDGSEYSAIALSEPTTGAIEAAERTLARGTNPASLRLYQSVLVTKCGDLPGSVISQLPVRIVDQAALFLQVFTKASQATGAI